jgi:hypothetical protein
MSDSKSPTVSFSEQQTVNAQKFNESETFISLSDWLIGDSHTARPYF